MKTLRRRRRENKTNYLKRIKLLKSETPRAVFRRTNKYFIVQYVTSYDAQDKIIFGITSKELLKYGWPNEMKGSLKSVPAAYLVGYLFGKKVQTNKIVKPIIDIGMMRTEHKSRIYGFLKGLIDSGLDISCDDKFFPDEGRIKGKHMKKDFVSSFDKIKSNIDKK